MVHPEEMKDDFSADEAKIADAILVARQVQDFIWGDQAEGDGETFDQERWTKMFQKRVDAISEVDTDDPAAVVELRKRILQQAALSVRALAILDDEIDLKDKSGAAAPDNVLQLNLPPVPPD